MIELIGLALGGIFRLIPEFLKLRTQKVDQAHELRMTQLQLEIDKARATQQLDLVHAQAGVVSAAGEMQAWADAIANQGKPTGVPWIDGLSASVRPVLTYWWLMVLYTACKAITIYLAVESQQGLAEIAAQIYTEFDRAVASSMMSFWFVDRSLRVK